MLRQVCAGCVHQRKRPDAMVWEVVLVLLLGRGCRTSRGERRLLGKNGRRHRSSMTLRRTILKKAKAHERKENGWAAAHTLTPARPRSTTSTRPCPCPCLAQCPVLSSLSFSTPTPTPMPTSTVHPRSPVPVLSCFFSLPPSNSECDRCCLLIAHVPQDGLIQIASSGYFSLLPLAQDHVFHVAPASCDFRQVLRSYRARSERASHPRPPSPRPARNAGTKVGRCFPHCALTDPGYLSVDGLRMRKGFHHTTSICPTGCANEERIFLDNGVVGFSVRRLAWW